MKSRKALLSAAAAGALSVATATTAVATTDVQATRLAGAGRYQTSRVVADATFGADTTVAVLASGERFPDALAASYLAGAVGGPVILTESGQLSTAASQALEAVGASGVLLVGGPAAVSEDVVAELVEQGYEVDRVAGENRYETARAVAESVPEEQIGSLQADIGRTMILASGERFADALSAGPLAYQSAFPLLLTAQNVLSEHARASIELLDIEQVVIVGGTAAVSNEVEVAVEALDVEVRRIAGDDRTLTAAAIADVAVDQLGFSTSHVNVARGDNFADALTGSAHAGAELALILLTETPDSLGSAAAGWLSKHDDTLTAIHVFGGPSAVSDATVNAAEVAAGRTP